MERFHVHTRSKRRLFYIPSPVLCDAFPSPAAIHITFRQSVLNIVAQTFSVDRFTRWIPDCGLLLEQR